MSAVIDIPQPDVQVASRRRPPYGGRIGWVRSFISRKPLGAIGGALVLMLLLVAIAAPVTAPYPYDVGNSAERLQGPTLAHPFGTDANGRDMLSRIIWGAQVSVTVGFGAVLISTVLAVTVGLISGYYGGWVDLLVQRLVDIWISFPALVLLISLVAIAGPGLWSITAILGILLAPGTSRVVRSAVLSIRYLPYIESGHCIGAGDVRVLLTYILPNVFAPIIVLATVQLGDGDPGGIDAQLPGLRRAATVPGLGQHAERNGPGVYAAIALALDLAGPGDQSGGLRVQHAGDALRDELDPRLRGVPMNGGALSSRHHGRTSRQSVIGPSLDWSASHPLVILSLRRISQAARSDCEILPTFGLLALLAQGGMCSTRPTRSHSPSRRELWRFGSGGGVHLAHPPPPSPSRCHGDRWVPRSAVHGAEKAPW